MNTDNYIVKSLELYLFFGRIMKEHSLFLRAGFTPADPSFSARAEEYKKDFENLLCAAVMLSDGVIGRDVLRSGELVTEFTALAEKQTEALTDISINREITAKELRLRHGCCGNNIDAETRHRVKQLNQKALKLVDGLISFKEGVLKNVLRCEMFTMNYPLLLEHIIREAKLYREYIAVLEREGCLTDESMRDTECFWNQIMMEHALFIRGLLDPTEEDLIRLADGFAADYAKLLENCRNAHDRTLRVNSLDETLKFRDFKATGTRGITGCEIRSVILPLLADHVLREANHYIRLLKE